MAYRGTSLAQVDRADLDGFAASAEVERLRDQVSALIAEREALKTELALAQAWTRELAHLVDGRQEVGDPGEGARKGGLGARLRAECGLCGHTRLWHYLHLVPWDRD